MLKIGGILRARMLQKDIKQKELANILKVDQRTISSYCRDISYPNLETLSVLCDILEIDLNELLHIHAAGNIDLMIQDDNEYKLLQEFRKLPPKKKTLFTKSMIQMIQLCKEQEKKQNQK